MAKKKIRAYNDLIKFKGDEIMSKQVALTFDDGPNTTTTLEVLEKLKKYGVVGSFFLIANEINEESKESVKKAYAMGCEIANHSKTHPDMTKLTAEEIKAEITYTNEKIFEIIGEYPRFFRPPYILVNDTMIQNIDLPFICGVGGRDWEPEVSPEERARLILENIQDGSIILLHDLLGNDKTVEALDIIIPALLKEGYECVTISDLFKNKGVTPTVHSGIVYSHTSDTKPFEA